MIANITQLGDFVPGRAVPATRLPNMGERYGSEARPHRLLFLVQNDRLGMGGAENSAVYLREALEARGYDMHVMALANRHMRYRHAVDHGIERIVSDPSWDLVADWGLFSQSAHVYRLGNATYADYLAKSIWAQPPATRWLKRLRGILPKCRRRLAHEARLLGRRDAWFLANSELGADAAVAAGASRRRLQVIHNGVNIHQFHPHRLRRPMRDYWGLNESHTVCLFVAHNIVLKNIYLLRGVFDELHHRHPLLRLVVVGKRPPNFSAPYLIYAGATTDMPRMYAGGDLLIHPSCYDPFGNVVLEAMSCGLPVVCSTWTGMGEVLEDGVNGFTLPVTASAQAQWCHLIGQLVTEPRLRQDIGAAGRQLSTRFRFDIYVDRVEKFLAEIYRHVHCDV